MNGVVIGPAGLQDVGELLTVQRAAYVSEALLYDDVQIPPLTETLDEVRAGLADSTVLVARDGGPGGRLVGSIRGRVEGEVLRIGRLSVAPDRHGEGIGTALVRALEATVGDGVTTAALFTGFRSDDNVRLYERLGYRVTQYEWTSSEFALVHLDKRLSG